jgi:Calcineurin-like phosphoesterase
MSKKRAAKDKSKKKSHKHMHHKKDSASPPASPTACAEHGVWADMTQVKHPPADHQPLQFTNADPDENERILSSGKMSFAMVGCSGDPMIETNTQAVGAAISADKDLSFLYHLGDMIYTISGSDTEGGKPVTPHSRSLWDNQLFRPFAKFPKKIFAIAGNHDGKYKQKIKALTARYPTR